MSKIIPFRIPPEKILADRAKRYDRSDALEILPHVPEAWRLSPIELQLAYAPRKALEIVLKTRRIVRRAIEIEHNLLRKGKWYYQPERHTLLRQMYQQETALAWRLYDCWQIGLRKERMRVAAEAFTATRAELAQLINGKVA